MKKVTLFSKNNCPHCKQAEQLLTQLKVNYRLCNIQTSAGQKQWYKLGFRSVPVIKIGEDYVLGFDPKKIKALLDRVDL